MSKIQKQNISSTGLVEVTLFVKSPSTFAEFYLPNVGIWAHKVRAACHLAHYSSNIIVLLTSVTLSQDHMGSIRDRYWKIGIKLPDFNHVCRDLQTKGVAVPALYHFKDIYFMSHLSNLEGFQIELIQNTFLDKGKSVTARMYNTLGGRCQFKQIPLGTTYIVPEISYFVYDSGMKLLSSLPLYAYGFELLFFLGCTEKNPPNSDLIVLESCPWQ